MKKIFIGSTFILFTAIVYYYFQTTSVDEKENSSWVTFKKTSPKKIDSYPTTAKEKKEAKISANLNHGQEDNSAKTEKRSPASLRPNAQTESLKGRLWNLHANQKLPKEISFQNSPKDNWKSLMGQDVMRFLRPETLLFVQKQKSLTLLERGVGLHVEQVYVKMISPEGRHYSYNAFVDSETGKVVRTWNQTIHEPMGKKTTKMRPSGFINPNGAQQF